MTQERSRSSGCPLSYAPRRAHCSRCGATTCAPTGRKTSTDLQGRGVEIHLPRYQPRSTMPLAACLWAGEQDALRPFKHALYEAFFCEGEDIATDREIARAAERAGLDPDDAVAAAYSHERFAQIREIRRVAEAGGVRGVPTLVTEGGESHWGMGGLEWYLAGEPLVPRV